jgi:hypothetical protein
MRFTSMSEQQASPVTLFSVEDTVMALCYVDASIGKLNGLFHH